MAGAILSRSALPELERLQFTKQRLAALLRNNAHSHAVLPIEQGLAEARKTSNLTERGEARLVLIVDQLEELFTVSVSDRERDAFAATLEVLAQSGLVGVLAAMRNDFFHRLDELPALSRLSSGDARYALVPPSDGELVQIIRGPAREAGLSFDIDADGVSLDDVVREAASKDRNALPLLSFLLDELWRRRNDRKLTFAAYEALGGFEGALARRAEDLFQAQPQDAQAALPRVLRALVRVEREAQITAKATPLASFLPGSPERRLVDAFSAANARLLVISDVMSSAPEPYVRVAHEALLTHWERARDSIEADRGDLEIEGRLTEATHRWENAAPALRASLLLSSGLPLEEAKAFQARRKLELDPKLSTFIGASGDA